MPEGVDARRQAEGIGPRSNIENIREEVSETTVRINPQITLHDAESSLHRRTLVDQ